MSLLPSDINGRRGWHRQPAADPISAPVPVAPAASLAPVPHQVVTPEVLPPENVALVKARGGGTAAAYATPEEVAKAWAYDPTQLQSAQQYGYIEPQEVSSFGFSMLRRLARVPPIAAIIQTRLNQIAQFAVPQSIDYQPGFRIALREKKRAPTKAEQKIIEEMTRWFEHGGYYSNVNQLYLRKPFEYFLRQFYRDSLEIDQAVFEVLFNPWTGQVAGYQAVDGTTIRRVVPGSTRQIVGATGAVFCQVLRNNQPIEFWGPGQMCLGVRRPRTDLESFGYGYSEMEELYKLVTGWLFGFESNMNIFRNQANIGGLLKFKMMPEDKFNAFQRGWKAMVSGASNAKVQPMVNMPDEKADADFVRMQFTNQEMEFFEWLGWVYRLICADYQIDAIETGFQFGQEGMKSTLNEHGPRDRMRSSLSRGLLPLLRNGENWFNVHLIWPLYDWLCLKFIGMDPETEAERVEIDAKRVRSTRTVNESRALLDEEPLPWGDVILDPVAIQAKVAYDIQAGLLNPASVGDSQCSCGSVDADTQPDEVSPNETLEAGNVKRPNANKVAKAIEQPARDRLIDLVL